MIINLDKDRRRVESAAVEITFIIRSRFWATTIKNNMNFTYTTNPGYSDLFFDLFKALQWHYRAENWGDYKFPESFYYDIKRYFNVPYVEIYPIIYIAIAFTIVRYAFEILICKVGTTLYYILFYCDTINHFASLGCNKY